MAFCVQSKENFNEGYLLLENQFCESFLSDCNEIQLKVYLFGFYLCSQPLSEDNSLEHLCDALGIDDRSATEAFAYWAELGLINICSYEPLEIQYRSLRNLTKTRHYKKEKYADFNTLLQNLFPSVAFTNPNQYIPYYDFIEESKLSPEVMIMIARYCVNKKGEKISANYIIAVARNWVAEGVRTIDDVDNRIKQFEAITENLIAVARALGKKSELTIEDKQLYSKWTTAWGFAHDAILCAAKLSSKSGGMNRLDILLDEYFRHNCISADEMTQYSKNKRHTQDFAIQVVKKLGLWYDNVDLIIEKYITPWLAKGFDESSILYVAELCFMSSIRTLEGMNNAIDNFYKNGCLTILSINEYQETLRKTDAEIKRLIGLSASSRNVTATDRDMFKMWQTVWGIDINLIEYACELAVGRPYAFSYVNQLLSRWKNKNINTVAMAQQEFAETRNQNKASSDFNSDDRKEVAPENIGKLENFDKLKNFEF